jgi:hypothetical protein
MRKGHDASAHEGSGHQDHASHHAQMVRDFRRRFWISLVLTAPVLALALAPLIQGLLGVEDAWRFPGDSYVQFGFATLIFFYGGWPFLTGLVGELRQKRPGMMTLIAMAIGVAWGYSTLVVFGLAGSVFFWELATLIDVMLLGHWIEMRSVMSASNALEERVKLMPAEAHRVREDGSTEDVPTTELAPGDRVVVKPGEKIPIDGVVVEGRSTVNEAMLTGESLRSSARRHRLRQDGDAHRRSVRRLRSRRTRRRGRRRDPPPRGETGEPVGASDRRRHRGGRRGEGRLVSRAQGLRRDPGQGRRGPRGRAADEGGEPLLSEREGEVGRRPPCGRAGG